MSLRAITWARSVPLAPTCKIVLLDSRGEADDAGVCVANGQKVAHKSGLNDDMFQQTIGQLESAGRIAVDEQGGDRHAKRYILALN